MSVKDEALRLAVLTALRDKIDEEVTVLRRDTTADLADLNNTVGVRSLDVSLPDGEPVAVVTLTGYDPKPTVLDEDAFTEWVRAHHPSEIVEMVRPSFQKALLDRCSLVETDHTDPATRGFTNEAVDNATGEVVAGVGPGGHYRPGIRVTYKRGSGRDAIAAAWRDGTLSVPLLPAAEQDV